MLFSGSSRSAALDGLRGLAALAVLVFHAWLYTLPDPRPYHRDGLTDFALHELRLGLVLFFVLSGYLLYRPWVRAALSGAELPRLGDYLRRRAARILPAYYAALLGSVALLWSLGGATGVRLPPIEGLALFAVFAQNVSDETVMKLDPPMWTLAVEVSFYLVLPAIGWFALRLDRRRVAQALIPLALVFVGIRWNQWLADEQPGLPYVKSLPAMLPYFAAGMLAAVVVHGRRIGRTAGIVLCAVSLALVGADAVWHASIAAAKERSDLALVVRDALAALGFAVLVAVVGARQRSRRGLLAARPLAFLGTISYGLYLWHVPLLLWLRANGLLPLDPLGATLVAGVLTAAVATVSWQLLERPAIVWARARAARRVAASHDRSGPGSPDTAWTRRGHGQGPLHERRAGFAHD